MKPRILTTIAALLTAATLHAQTWDGGGVAGGNLDWITATNWSLDVAPANNATANIIFAGTIDNNPGPNLDQNWNVNSVTFNNTAGAFTLGSTGGIALTIGVGGIVNNDTQTQTISHSIALGSAQTWNAASGGLNMISGTLNNGGNLLTVTGASDVLLSNTMTGAGGLTNAGLITGDGTITKLLTNSGEVRSASGRTLRFTGGTAANTGTLALQGGTIEFTSAITNNGVMAFSRNSATPSICSMPARLRAISTRSPRPPLGGGNAWDFSALKTNGIVTVVPEPAVTTLLLASLCVLGFRRRK